MNTNDVSTLNKFIQNNLKEFRPVAYYDKHLDCIRVQIKDCSFTEKRLNSIFTILEVNHVDIKEYAGFNIKGIKYLFKKVGLPDNGVIKLAQVIDAIVKIYPDWAIKYIRENFKKPLETLEVDLACAA